MHEASEATGWSENAIRIKCGKKNTDCQWVDEKTKRSKRAKRNKKAGNNFELSVIRELRDRGYTGCVSSRSQNKLADANKIDIVDMNDDLGCFIQCKNTIATPNYFKIANSCTDDRKPFVVMWKKAGLSRDNTIAMLPAEYFYDLMKIALDEDRNRHRRSSK